MKGTYENQYTFLIIHLSVLVRMRNVSDKIRRDDQNTHYMFNKFSQKILPFMRQRAKLL